MNHQAYWTPKQRLRRAACRIWRWANRHDEGLVIGFLIGVGLVLVTQWLKDVGA